MPKKKKDTKNDIEKLNRVLDDGTKTSISKDEKYLQTLKERLDESNQKNTTFTEKLQNDEELSEEDLLKPTVVVHERIEKKPSNLPEFEEVKEEVEFVEKQEVKKVEDEDLVDVEKVKPSLPEFVEVKPKPVKIEKTEEKTFETVEPEKPIEELEEKEETVEFTKVESKEIEVEKEPIEPDETEEIVEIFKDVQSIDKETALLLYSNGYTDIDSLKKATVKDLRKIKGLKRKTAKQIKKELPEPEPETWDLPLDSEEELDDIEQEETKIIEFDETIYCRECGASINSHMIFCHKCGTKLKEEDEALEADQTDLEKTADTKDIEIGETAEKEITTEEVEELDDDTIPIEEKIKPFEEIESIDEDTAIILYNSGYISFDSIKNVDIKELRKIKGINRKKAKKIREEIDKKIIESTQLKPIDIGETSEGVVTKDQIETEEDFEEEKQPLNPVELTAKKEWQPLEEEIETPEKEDLEEKLEQEIKKETEEEMWESVEAEAFKDLKSIDEETAKILCDNGFNSMESLKKADFKDLKKIKGINRKKAKEILKEIEGLKAEDKIEEMILGEDEEYFKDEELSEKESKKLDEKILNHAEEPIIEEELFIEEEIIEEIPEEKIDEKEETEDELNKIPIIDKKIKDLLKENNIDTLQDLDNATIKELTKIKGIRRKTAKQIKKELKKYLSSLEKEEDVPSVEENPFINEDDFSEDDEWETFEEPSKKPKKSSKKKSVQREYTIYKNGNGEYTLYKKEVITKNNKKRTIRFFSKGEPEDSEPIKLPKGYEIKENKKTGVPYLKKKKKK